MPANDPATPLQDGCYWTLQRVPTPNPLPPPMPPPIMPPPPVVVNPTQQKPKWTPTPTPPKRATFIPVSDIGSGSIRYPYGTAVFGSLCSWRWVKGQGMRYVCESGSFIGYMT